jgi:hypothetical protein
MAILARLLREPPFRLFPKTAARWWPRFFSLATQVKWDAPDRPSYALGMLFAAQRAKCLGIPEICVVEFGVASGQGLLVMQSHAALAKRETGTRINVFGFDTGTGLPSVSDFRDQPDCWKAGDFPMDIRALSARLYPNTHLVLGEVAETVPDFVAKQSAPVGFAAFDLDLYSSTRAALQLFALPGRKMLPHTPLYFDDISFSFSHRFAGGLLAIDEFNREIDSTKIDRWRGVESLTSFPESPWLDGMYIAHDLAAAPTMRTKALIL